MLAANAAEIALAQVIVSTLQDHTSLGVRLQELPFDWKDAPHRLTGNFYYLSFADGVPTVDQFIDYLYGCLIPYCLPKKVYHPVLQHADPKKDFARIVRLGDTARHLFINAKNQLESGGEAGELILYALLEWALKSPKFVAKMYLKTNNNMPVHGTDGIHLGYDPDTDKMTVYFGESKIYNTFSGAADAAFSSINELIKNTGQITREIDILLNDSDLDMLPDPVKMKICDYIDPYSNSHLSLNKKVVHACFLGFDYKSYKRILKLPPSNVNSKFEEVYLKRISAACRVINRHYSTRLPLTTNLHIFLLPFTSIEEFRGKFYHKIGIAA